MPRTCVVKKAFLPCRHQQTEEVALTSEARPACGMCRGSYLLDGQLFGLAKEGEDVGWLGKQKLEDRAVPSVLPGRLGREDALGGH